MLVAMCFMRFLYSGPYFTIFGHDKETMQLCVKIITNFMLHKNFGQHM
jgi:hypothetical protein